MISLKCVPVQSAGLHEWYLTKNTNSARKSSKDSLALLDGGDQLGEVRMSINNIRTIVAFYYCLQKL